MIMMGERSADGDSMESGSGNLVGKKMKRSTNRLNTPKYLLRRDANQQQKLLNPYARKKLTASIAATGSCNQKRRKDKRDDQMAANGEPFARSIKKLEKAMKYQIRKMKAVQMRQQQKHSALKTHLIVIESSDEDDVIEVKLPSPPVVTVADSSDELSNEEECSSSNNLSTINVIPDEHESGENRCESPNSNISDDFIDNADRFRLMQDDDESVGENEVLMCSSEENCLSSPNADETSENLNDLNDENIFVSPQKKTKKKRETTNSDYKVTQSNFRALDVYESESSDMPESVYAKGRTKGPSRASSSSDVVEINDNDEEIQKKKKLRKRRSSSNRGSEATNDESTTDGDENVDDNNDENREGRGLPFISRGEAVENCKRKFGGKKRTKSLDKHTTDHEFVSILKNIAQGGQTDDDDDGNETDISTKSDDEDNCKNITARHIAEEVISRRRSSGGCQTKMVIEQQVTAEEIEEEEKKDENMRSIEDINIENPSNKLCIKKERIREEEEAVPKTINRKLDQVLGIIDKLQDSDHECNDDGEDIDVGNEEFDEFDDNGDDGDVIQEVEKEMISEGDGGGSDVIINDEASQIIQLLDMGSENPPRNFLKVVYSNSSKHIGWNDEMIRFYDHSWNGENFSVYEIKKSMNVNSRWTIYNNDRFPKGRKFSNLKCYNCCEFGHNQMRCPRPKKDLICFMCGEIGHREPRCPNTICLRCGNKTRVFMKFCSACSPQNRLTCPICKIRGHSIDFCPDKWRRYHSTTIPNECPNKNIVYNKKKYCCICAGCGHLAENCRNAVRFSQYPSISSEIKSHAKSYEDIQITYSIAPNVIAYNLFYEPNESITFDFSVSNTIKQRQYYWRFLNAVGLRHLLARKREIMKVIKCSKKMEEKGKGEAESEGEPKEKKSKTNNGDKDKNVADDNMNLLSTQKNILMKTRKLENNNKLKSVKSSENPLLRRVLKKNFEKQNINLEMVGNVVINDTTVENEMAKVEERDAVMQENTFSEKDTVAYRDTFMKGSAVVGEQEKIVEMEDKRVNDEKVQTIEANLQEEVVSWKKESKTQEEAEDDAKIQENENENIIFVDDNSNDCEQNREKGSKDLEKQDEVIMIKFEEPPLEVVTDDRDEVISCGTNESEDNDTNYGDDDDDDEEEDDMDSEDDPTSCKKSSSVMNGNCKSVEPPADFLMNVLTPNKSSNNEEEVSQLPDFIPLSTVDDDFFTDDTFNNNPIGISHRLSGKNYEGECTNFIPDRDMPGAVKIHLTNFHGKYLLSAEGQKFLIEKCGKHNIKASISWTSQGNILIINGLPKDRVRFHTDLLLTFRNVTETPSCSCKITIPRRRITLIKFIQREILQLKKNLGNVHSIYTQFSVPKIASSKDSYKAMRKGRRLLNMILLGQIGLGDGRQHLRALTDLLKVLQESYYERAPDDIQKEIYVHWKYIFSSQIHDNIHQWFKEYVQMKRQNQITRFNLVKTLGKNAIYVNFTKKSPNKTKRLQQSNGEGSSLNQMVTGKKNENFVFNPFSLYGGMIPGIIRSIDGNNAQVEEKDQQQEQQTGGDYMSQDGTTTSDTAAITTDANKSSNDDSISSTNTNSSLTNSAGQLKEKIIENNTKISENSIATETATVVTNVMMKSLQEKSSSSSSSSFVSNKINEVKKVWEVQCENLLNKIGYNRTQNDDKKKSNEKSVFWSRECIKFIDQCDAMENFINADVKMKLKKINVMAKVGELSHNDCVLMTKVYNLIKAKAT